MTRTPAADRDSQSGQSVTDDMPVHESVSDWQLSGFVVVVVGGGDNGGIVFVVCEQAYARKKQLPSFGIYTFFGQYSVTQ